MTSPKLAAAGVAFALFASACGSESAVDDVAAELDTAASAAVDTATDVDATAPDTTQTEDPAVSADPPAPAGDDADTPGASEEVIAASTDESIAASTDEGIAAGAPVALPELPAIDLLTGDTIAMNDLNVTGPALVWFWAPH